MSALKEQNPEANIAKTEAKTLEQLEEDKLKAEIAKIEAETKVLKRRTIFNPSAWIPLVVAIVGLLGTTSQWITTWNELGEKNEQLVQDSVGYESQIKGLVNRIELGSFSASDDPDSIAAVVNAVAKLPEKVVIQFQGSLTREFMTALQGEFNSQGMPAPRPERIGGGYRNSVRYFHSSDAALAIPVLDVITDFYQDKGCPINITVQKFLELPSPKGQIEVWIIQNCSG